MNEKAEKNPWVWVMVQGAAGNEQYVGQHDAESDVLFIPAFPTKDDGLKGFHLVNRDKSQKVEVQAVRLKELAEDAAANGFMIFVIDGEGSIKEKLDPRDL
ncbi:MAG: hypothetical protein R6U50_15300 [Desulfobacterales bacterium]